MGEHYQIIRDLMFDKLAEIAPDLNAKPKKSGQQYEIACPECGARESYLYRNGLKIKCNRGKNCRLSEKGVYISLEDYLQNYYKWPAGDYQTTMREIARMVGYDALPEPTPEAVERINRERAEAKTRENLFNAFKMWFVFGQSADCLKDYLHERGWSAGEIDGMDGIEDVGYFSHNLVETAIQSGTVSGEDEIKLLKEIDGFVRYFEKKSEAETVEDKTAEMFDGGFYRFVSPWRGPSGEIKGFVFRSINKATKKRKYLVYPSGLERSLFNIHNARRTRTDLIYLVEGVIDALRLDHGGMSNVVALGGAGLESAPEAIKQAGFKQVVLMLDNDKAGIDGIKSIIIDLNKKGLKSYCVAFPPDIKDPDEFLRAGHTIEDLKNLLRIHGLEWFTRFKFDKAGADAAERDKALSEVMKLVDDVGTVAEKGPIVKALADYGYDTDEIGRKLSEIEAKKRERETRAESIKALENALKDIKDGQSAEKVFEIVKDAQQSIRLKNFENRFKPYTLNDFDEDFKNIPPSLTLDAHKWGGVLYKNVKIQTGAVTVIAGRPGHGKTTFLVNLAAYFAKKYRDKTFVYINYEEMQRDIAWRFISILSENRKDLKTRGEYSKAIKDGESIDAVKLGRREFDELTKQSRILIDCQCFGITDLCNHIAYYRDKFNLGAVLIDYIQKVRNDAKDMKHASRQQEIQIVSDKLVQTARESAIPIIVGCQVSRQKEGGPPELQHLRESGDLEQDANIVLGLYNPAKDAENKDGNKQRKANELTPESIPLEVHILKNRNGKINETGVINWYQAEYFLKGEAPAQGYE